RHTRLQGDWSSDVCSSDLRNPAGLEQRRIDACRGEAGHRVELVDQDVLALHEEVDPREAGAVDDPEGGHGELADPLDHALGDTKIGRASCRERVWTEERAG